MVDFPNFDNLLKLRDPRLFSNLLIIINNLFSNGYLIYWAMLENKLHFDFLGMLVFSFLSSIILSYWLFVITISIRGSKGTEAEIYGRIYSWVTFGNLLIQFALLGFIVIRLWNQGFFA